MPVRSVLRTFGLSLLIWYLTIDSATANSWPPMAIWLLQVPLSAGLISYGLGFVAIVLLEGFILSRRERLTLRRSMIATSLANLCSLILGFMVIIGLTALPYSILGTVFLGISDILLIGFSMYFVPYLRLLNLSRYPVWRTLLRLLLWSGFWSVTLLSSWWLIIVINSLNLSTVAGGHFPDPNVPFYVNISGSNLVCV